MADIESSIKFNIDLESIGKLRRELASLNVQYAETQEGTEAFRKLEDQIKKTESAITKAEGAFGDATDKIKTLSGSGVERFNASFGLMREGIQNLDLDKFKIGIQGATQAFGGLKQAIIATGIGALVLIITAIISNFDKLAAAGGIVGKVFTAIGDIVNGLIQGLKDLLDWMNLTNIAASEAAEAEKKYKESIDESNKSLGESRRRVLVATGKLSEEEAERQRLKEDFITNYLKAQEEARLKIKEAKTNAEKDIIAKDLKLRLQAISQEYTADLVELNKSIGDKKAAEKKAADDKSKADAEKRKQDNDKKLADEKKAAQDFNNVVKQLEQQRATEDEKIIIEAENKKIELKKKFNSLSIEEQKLQEQKLKDELIAIDQDAYNKQQELDKKRATEEESKRKEEQEKQKQNLENYTKTITDIELNGMSEKDRMLAEAEDTRKAERKLLTDEFQLLTQEEQIIRKQEFEDALIKIDEEAAAKKEKIVVDSEQKIAEARDKARQAAINNAQKLGTALISIGVSLSEFGKKSEKQKIKDQRNATLAGIALSTGIGIAQAVSDGMKVGVTPIEKGIAIAGGIALVLANIAKARQTVKQADEAIRKLGESTPPPPDLNVSQSGGGGGSGGGNITPPTFNLGGQQIGGASNILGSNNVVTGQQPIKVFVSETDISAVQNKVQVTEGNSLFGGPQ